MLTFDTSIQMFWNDNFFKRIFHHNMYLGTLQRWTCKVKSKLNMIFLQKASWDIQPE